MAPLSCSFLPSEPALPPPPPPAEPIKECDDPLPTPPSMIEHVKRVAEERWSGGALTASKIPLTLLRTSMLLQDTIEAACMCVRAHVDPPLLGKHLLGAEQYQTFLKQSGQDFAAGDIGRWTGAVMDYVGDVRARRRRWPCARALPPPPLRARAGAAPTHPLRCTLCPPPRAPGLRSDAGRHPPAHLRQPH